MVVDDLGHRRPRIDAPLKWMRYHRRGCLHKPPSLTMLVILTVVTSVTREAQGRRHVRGTGPEPAGRRQARAGRWSPAASDGAAIGISGPPPFRA